MEMRERGARLARAGALQSNNRNLRRLTWKDIFVGPNHHAVQQPHDWTASEIRSEPESSSPRTLWLMHLETCQRAPPAGCAFNCPHSFIS